MGMSAEQLILRFQTTRPRVRGYRIVERFYAMRCITLDEEQIFVPGSIVSADPNAPIGAGLAEPSAERARELV